ncbi:hypothetical protein WMF11_25885 [Sorangium sp. So ce295]|uniref:hypothetical protein n=1 Tax=Sorangium sp. So ce295 TaxID=3133295 RepID=UPI003F644A68
MVRLLPCSAGLSKKRSTGRSPARTVALEFDEPAIASRQVQNKHGTILEKSTMNACRSERSRCESRSHWDLHTGTTEIRA